MDTFKERLRDKFHDIEVVISQTYYAYENEYSFADKRNANLPFVLQSLAKVKCDLILELQRIMDCVQDLDE